MLPSRSLAMVAPLLLVATSCSSPGAGGGTALTTSTSRPPEAPGTHAPRPFDVEAFLSQELEGLFPDQVGMRVGVVVLAPTDLETEVDTLLSDLTELEGYSHVSAEMVATAAARFASTQNMGALEGRWVAFGLEPQYLDSPVAEWEEILRSVEGVLVSRVDFEAATLDLAEGWEAWQPIADLPFVVADGAVVEAVDRGIVVVDEAATRLIGLDGSVVTRDAPPLSVPAECCGSVSGFPTGDSLVVIDEMTGATWILDVESLAWREADPKPTTGDGNGGGPLGSASIDGGLFVVDAASRRGDATSSAAVLDLDSGTWRVLEPVPSPISTGGVTTDGGRVYVAGTRQDGNNNIIGERSPLVYQYTQAQGWRQLPNITIDGQSSTVVWVDGIGLLAWNYDLQSARFDETGSWRALGEVPMPPSECGPQSDPTTAGMVGQCGGLAWFDSATEKWTPIWQPTPNTALHTRFAVTDTTLIGFVEVARDQTQMLAYPLPPDEG